MALLNHEKMLLEKRLGANGLNSHEGYWVIAKQFGERTGLLKRDVRTHLSRIGQPREDRRGNKIKRGKGIVYFPKNRVFAHETHASISARKHE